ncbi:hypothetical protein J4727_09440 [Providencia rettgeri]|uniref:Uncharacterized protein n=1 Tax=Providencia rettgeri TaxID=587 RepID=A0A939NK47_PRORE|nr:hypothetical protein [Providencia rettgeri]
MSDLQNRSITTNFNSREEYNKAVANGYQPSMVAYQNKQILLKTIGLDDTNYTVYITKRKTLSTQKMAFLDVNFRTEWKSDNDGRYTTKTNPFHNGTFDSQARAVAQ